MGQWIKRDSNENYTVKFPSFLNSFVDFHGKTVFAPETNDDVTEVIKRTKKDAMLPSFPFYRLITKADETRPGVMNLWLLYVTKHDYDMVEEGRWINVSYLSTEWLLNDGFIEQLNEAVKNQKQKKRNDIFGGVNHEAFKGFYNEYPSDTTAGPIQYRYSEYNYSASSGTASTSF